MTSDAVLPVDDPPDEDPYAVFVSKKILVMVIMAVVIIIIALFSIASGAYRLSVADVLRIIFTGGTTVENTVIWNLRVPRVLAAIIVGAALGVAGAVMQCVLKNPLASPYTLGISSSAAFGAALSLAISYFGLFSGTIVGEFFSGVYGMTLNAFIWAMITVGIIIFLSRLVTATPESMILTGVALGAIFAAALSSLQYFVDDTTLSSMVYWQFGDLSKVNYTKLAIMGIALFATSAYFIYKRWDYNAMEAGEDVAKSMGVNTKGTLLMTMTLASTVTAICISIVGIIGFIGLLAPHVMRRIIGGDNRFLIPASMLAGALILIAADTFGRLAFVFTLPVGIITSFLGGPLFIYILSRGKKRSAV